MIFLLIVKVFGMTLQMSQMESRQKELVQRIALDQKDREELELKIQRFLEKAESAGEDGREVTGTKKAGGEETDGIETIYDGKPGSILKHSIEQSTH